MKPTGKENVAWRAGLMVRVRNCPLLVTRPSSRGLAALTGDVRPGAVFLGVGLCVPGRASSGVPLDVLGLLLGADALRRAIGAKRVVLLLADQHAWDSGVRGAALDRIEQRWHQALRSLALTFPALEWISARTLHAEAEHRVHRRRLDTLAGYVRAQTADLLTLTARRGRLLKLGWTLGADVPRGDERYFDAVAAPYCGGHVGFVYGPAGRALRQQQPRLAPYVALDPDSRLMLAPGEDVAAKLAWATARLPSNARRSVANHYRRLAYVYNQNVSPLRGSLEERLQQIIAECTHSSARSGTESEKRHVI